MILNPSHDITLKGLPSEILDAYVRYKKGSRAIVSWLAQFGPTRYKGVKTLPIKELASLARSVTKSIKELPEVIHFHFKETIAARKRLSQFFRRSVDVCEHDFDTVNHEHFTTSLTQIYSDLCEHCQSINRANGISVNAQALCIADPAKPLQNHYACLPVEDAADVDGDFANGEETKCDECRFEEPYRCSGAPNDLCIENDEMGIAIETASILQRVDETIQATELCWEQAGRGQVHFVAAAAVTNVAWSTLRDLEGQLRDIDTSLNLSTLHQRCCLFNETGTGSNNTFTNLHVLLEQLAESEQAIAHYSNCHRLTVTAHCPSCVQKPSEYVENPSSSKVEQTKNGLPRALMNNILHLMCRPQPSSIVLQSSPIYAEIGYLLTHRDDKTTSFQCTLGLHLLSTTYRSYLTALSNPSTISSCRITSLKLSQQATSTLEVILNDRESFPCRCPETLAHHMCNLKEDMETYTKHKCWDLYFQSPWVAGNHIIEMLDSLSYYGMRLFHYKHYVASVLHSYNVLVQLAGLETIPVLERLIETFKDVFFPTGRPVAYFKNSWARYVGARLKFNNSNNNKKGQKNKKIRHGSLDGSAGQKKDGWCMAVPAHAARNAAGLGLDPKACRNELEPKFDYGRIDPLIKLKQCGWRVLDTFVEKEKEKTRKKSTAGGGAATKRRNSTSSSTSTRSSNLNSDSCSCSSSSHPSSPTTDLNLNEPTSPSSSSSTPSQTQPSHQQYEHPLLTTLSTLTNHLPPPPPSPSSSQESQPHTPHNPPSTTTTTTLSPPLIYTTILSTIQKISHQIHSSSSSQPTNKNEPKNCICFTHTILNAADRIVEGRRYARNNNKKECWRKEEREVVDVVKMGLKEGMMVRAGEGEGAGAGDTGRGEVRWMWEV